MLKGSIVLNEEATRLEEMLDLNESGYYDINYIFGGDDEHDGEEFEYPIPEAEVTDFIMRMIKENPEKLDKLIEIYNNYGYIDDNVPEQVDRDTEGLEGYLRYLIEDDPGYYIDELDLYDELQDHYRDEAEDDAYEGKLARDPYSYYGVSRRDFY